MFVKNEVRSRGRFEGDKNHKVCVSWKSVQALGIESVLREYACKVRNDRYTISTRMLRTEVLEWHFKSLGVPVNRPFKSEYRHCYSEWTVTSIYQDTLADGTAEKAAFCLRLHNACFVNAWSIVGVNVARLHRGRRYVGW